MESKEGVYFYPCQKIALSETKNIMQDIIDDNTIYITQCKNTYRKSVIFNTEGMTREGVNDTLIRGLCKNCERR